MKKSVVSALTTALVVGATATTFAAANPFSDVPAGHWAYKSVARLAQQGIIEGYTDANGNPNGLFLGERNITRYEMAQMVAKALAKNPSGATKAELDKLAAEFREELDSLGVRVDELEKHADMVQWTGEIRYRYWNDKEDLAGGGDTKRTRSQLQIRLFPTAEVNENWKVKARFTATVDARLDQTGDAQLTYIYAEGKYDKFTANIGRMPLFTDVDGGIVADDFFSGLQLSFGDTLKAKLNAGRWNNGFNDPMDYAGLELLYNDKKNFNIGAGYHHFSSDDFTTRNGYSKTGDEDKAGIVTVGAGYKFGGGVKFTAAYAQNTKADEYDKGYNFELNYLGADRKKAGSWGAFIAYRYVGSNVGLATTFDSYSRRANKKGVDFGFTWSPLKNTLTKISYFHGKTLDTRENDRTFFGRVSFFF